MVWSRFRFSHVLFLCLALLLAAISVHAERRALLIGIGNYAPPAGAVPPAGHAADSRFAPGASWPALHGPAVDIASLQVLLQQKFDYRDIRVLPESQATRAGILAAIDKLIADTQPGDFDVIVYAGHGSRRLDTLSSKDHFDQTIVPIDASQGADDIRDKELAVLFNQIVYAKKAHLTAIFDSCNSGTMARGVTASVVRALPYDDRDVAAEKKKNPGTVVESDLKQIPQNGNAIIVAAAAPAESAAEALYSDDRQWHGAFSRALVQVLRSSTQSLSAADAVAEVSNMLHADGMFQQPSLEGRAQESLFGPPVANHPLHVRVLKAFGPTVTLDLGSAAGFDSGTQFTSLEPGPAGKKTVIEVRQIDEPMLSTAQVIDGPAGLKPGQIFELTKLTYPQGARLVIFAGKADSDPPAAAAAAKAAFPGLTWAADPTETVIDYLVVNGSDGWRAYGQNGRAVAPGNEAKGSAFLLLGPPASLRSAIEQTVPFQRSAFTFTDQLVDANYLLATRQRSGGSREYAFLDRNVLAPHAANAWVRSPEDDPDDAKLTGGTPPEVVCRNDVSLPVRTAWLPEPQNIDELVVALNRRIVRLGKLRVWLQSPAIAPGAAGWPYHLAITPPGSDQPIAGLLHSNQQYDVRLVTTAQELAAVVPSPKYVYLMGFDCAANPFLLYPDRSHSGDAMVPQPGPSGAFSPSVLLGVRQAVGTPLGADTLFLVAAAQKLTEPQVLVMDGVLDRGMRGAGNGFDALIGDMSDAATRGPHEVPTNWQVQSLVLPSRQ